MSQTKLERELDPKHLLKVLLYLRKKRFDGKYIEQKDIMEELPIKRNQTSLILKGFRENKLIDIKMINTMKNTGSRKMYKLNEKGQELADKILARGLNNDEKRLLDVYERIQNAENNKSQEDLWSIIQLFHDYGFDEKKNSLFSEMVRNFVNSVKEYFIYETQLEQESLLEETMIKE